MKSNPLFTIVLFAENEEKYLDDFFNCILKQTYKKIEVVFVDNHSYDMSYEKAVSYSHLFQKNGMELQISKNKKAYDFSNNVPLASRSIEGDYVVYLSAKDRIVPEYAEKVVNCFQNDATLGAVLYTQNYLQDENIIKSIVPDKDMTVGELRDRLIYKADFSMSQIVRKNALGGLIAKYRVTFNCYKHIYDLYILSCIANVGVVEEALVETVYEEEILPEETNMIKMFEKYAMLLAFQTKTRILLSENIDEKIKKGIHNLAEECIEVSERIRKLGNEKLAKKYARLALVFNPEQK